MKFENLIINKKGAILTIIINREKKLNALNKETLSELSLAIIDAQKDNSIGVIIISGAGDKAFIAGADISEFLDLSQEEGETLARNGQANVFDLIENSNKPFIAAINGFALGGGLELALACQIRIATDNAKLGLPEVGLGIIPGYGGTQRLTQIVGKGFANEMILTGEMIAADKALQIGVVNYVVPQIEILMKAEELAYKILQRSPEATESAIKAINASLNSKLNGFEVEIEEFGKCFNNSNFKEGVSAFLEKRKPQFKRY